MGLFGNLFGKKGGAENVGSDINPETGNFVNNDNNPHASAETLQNREVNLQARQAAENASQQARINELNNQTGPVADSAAVAEAGSAAYAQAYEQTKTEASQGLAGATFVNHDAAAAPETTTASTDEVQINIAPTPVEPILNEGAPMADPAVSAEATAVANELSTGEMQVIPNTPEPAAEAPTDNTATPTA